MGLFFGCNQAALADPANNVLTKSDIQQVLRMFSTAPCDISEFSKSSQSLGFKPFWTEYDDLKEMPLSVLDQDSLCLIALSASFKAYRMAKTKDGDKELTLAAPENRFPENKSVVEVTFFLPRLLISKNCVQFEGATAPYLITISKSRGKLQRDIRRTDADEACFIAEAKKKGMRAR